MKKTENRAAPLLLMAASMIIFGSIGLVVRKIELPSAMIALVRGAVGTCFLLAAQLCTGKKPSFSALRKNLPALLIAGAAIGFNWILLFEAYRYTTIATATVCYYTAPVFVILLSPLILHERLTKKAVLCAAVSLVGMVFVTGVIPGGFGGDLRGAAFGLAAAALYAVLVLANRFLKNIGSMDTTIAQLAIATVVLLPYVLLSGQFPTEIAAPSILPLAIAGVVHTGVAYLLYFSAMRGLRAQSIALCSYIDPVTAILFSALLLGEPMNLPQIVGTLLILGATLFGEIKSKRSHSET